MRRRDGTTSDIRAFWEAEACGERYGRAALGLDLEGIDANRYKLEPEIIDFLRPNVAFNGKGLEIGLGVGSDFVHNVGRGGSWTGLDLTGHSLDIVKKRVGRQTLLVQGDAQKLPFADNSFDYVYTWGVLLCCPNIQQSLDEVGRVLRPGGEFAMMLYHLRSWVAVAAWLRWGWWRRTGLRNAITFMESPGTQAFKIEEVESMLSSFSDAAVEPRHTSWDERWLGPLGRLGGDRYGWFLLCRATK